MLFRIPILILFLNLFFECYLLRIPLMRKKSPREIMMNMPDEFIQENLELFKPKPKPLPPNDTIPVFRYLDSEYYAIIGIGKPLRYFNLIFDTAWGNSWVISSNCDYTQAGCWFHNKYNARKSFTYVENGTPFNVDERTYNISGYLSTDQVHLGVHTVPNYTFAEITKLPWMYGFTKSDGVIGLSFKGLATSGTTPIFYEMLRLGLIAKPVFSVYLNRDRQSNRGGHILLGVVDTNHYNQSLSNFTYLQVTRAMYWQFSMDRVQLNDTAKKKTYVYCMNGCQSYVDTSTNVITGPASEINKINKMIQATPVIYGRYKVSCDTVNKLPDITFILADNPFVLKGPQYIQKVSMKGIQVCLSAFQPVQDSTLWGLGGVFLAEYYSSYDIENNRIGFVKAV